MRTGSSSSLRRMRKLMALINLMIPTRLPMAPCLPMPLLLLRSNSYISMGIFAMSSNLALSPMGWALSDISLFILAFVLYTNSSLFKLKSANEHREFRNYLFLFQYVASFKNFRDPIYKFLTDSFFYLLHWKFAEYFVYYLYKKLTID